ncbi:phage terminase small subunit [Gottfriedia acidiceleris]|uniref:phage terminase small subunit n=1 Tax=Gottfriedia acidiceleris TaxID=371036 RepID=UPI00101C1F6F|nr:phage terminase small subunit [Gottfriedia acidiceleris]
MARERNPNRDKAFELYHKHNGKITNREIANQLGEDEKKVAVWKQRDKWNVVQQEIKDVIQQTKRPRGAPKGSKNALGNKGGHGGPFGNSKALKHGFFSKFLPAETLAIMEEINQRSPIDLLWDQIQLQYAAIIRAQQLMYVANKHDMTKELKKTRETDSSSEEEYEIQFAWDKHANFLQAQSRAMSTLNNLIRQYEELSNTEEQQLRIKKLKGEIAKIERDINNDDTDDSIQIVIKRKGENNG